MSTIEGKNYEASAGCRMSRLTGLSESEQQPLSSFSGLLGQVETCVVCGRGFRVPRKMTELGVVLQERDAPILSQIGLCRACARAHVCVCVCVCVCVFVSRSRVLAQMLLKPTQSGWVYFRGMPSILHLDAIGTPNLPC